MNSFLVVGLESSCTRYVSILLAANLRLVPEGGWDGHDKLESKESSVVHRSLPHGSRDGFISESYWRSFKTVIICTRDFNCSLLSKIKWHQSDRDKAAMEQEKSREILRSIVLNHENTEVYSYESAFLIGRPYNEMFFSRIGVPYSFHEEIKEINSKYFPNV